jgi:hypothetical protein
MRILARIGGEVVGHGVAANMAELRTLVRYSFRQGIIDQEIEIESLFAPSMLNWLS